MLLSVAAAAFSATGKSWALPDAPKAPRCVKSGAGLHASWDAVPGADNYELQVSRVGERQAFQVVTTKRTRASVPGVLKDTSYELSLRAHAENAPSLASGTWGPVGASSVCTTTEAASTATAVGPSAVAETFWIQAVRESEYTYGVDYLANHNSGDAAGDASFLTSTSFSPDKPNFLNVTFRNSTYSQYCVEILKVDLPGTLNFNSSFADYLSCDDNMNPPDPECSCDNWIDRQIAGQNTSKYCFPKNHSETCGPHGSHASCVCNCTDVSMAQSVVYTGMMPVKPSGPQTGVWYSHPKDGECGEDEPVGTIRQDGSVCTWRRALEARVVRGGGLLANGWNNTRTCEDDRAVPPAQLLQNGEAMTRAFANVPLSARVCGQP
eukprot:TRINITY_DN749_c0_g1_i7.p1 TRINITY_DN749_c0_g1~~TRINITY_DN749_c0_g1_i7.p1  ORF type:complete len:380 (+),score=74.90 TRINITY_DN749_c0_g1_i7:92-1231(+)